MAKLSLPELKSVVSSVVTTAKLSNASFVETRNNIVGLLDKVGEIVTLDTIFTEDKLARFDGMYLSFGKIIEEWYQDLLLVEDYDPTGAGAMSPHAPTYRPVFYSYTIGRKKIPTTIFNNDIERAVHFTAQLVSIVAMNYKRLEDSMAQYRYQVKREILAKFYNLAEATLPANVGTTYATSTAYNVGTLLKSGSPAVVGIVVKPIANTNSDTWAQAIANGKVILLDLITEIAKPVDTSTGEAFIKQLKADVELCKDVSEGHSLNGNTIGVVGNPVLILKQGVMPSVDVDTLAGAFHLDKLNPGVDIIVIKDFGSADPELFGVLTDERSFRLHNTYNVVRENFNGDGDWLSLFRHTEDTAYISRNAFVKFYVEPSA